MADSAPAAEPAAPPAPPSRNPLRRLYAWILSFAHHPAGSWALAVFAFLDSFIFPIPPLFLQVALSIERPKRSFWYAFIDTAASVLGSIVGYGIGIFLFDSLGKWMMTTFHWEEQFRFAGEQFGKNAFTFILIYSFVPFPYKVITIASGFFHDQVPLAVLLLASTVGRGFRFFALGALCFCFGPRIKTFVDRYFNAVCLAVALLVVGVLAAMKLAPGLLGK